MAACAVYAARQRIGAFRARAIRSVTVETWTEGLVHGLRHIDSRRAAEGSTEAEDGSKSGDIGRGIADNGVLEEAWL